jgi:hypothetical protein
LTTAYSCDKGAKNPPFCIRSYAIPQAKKPPKRKPVLWELLDLEMACAIDRAVDITGRVPHIEAKLTVIIRDTPGIGEKPAAQGTISIS